MFYLLLIILYGAIFTAIYGYINFDVHYTDWCMLKHLHTNSDDINWNYLNFFAFLNGSAEIPYYQNMIHPFKGGALYIDYAPIIMVPLKIFYRNILHYKGIIDVQYVWYFGALCFILQGILSFKIIKKLTNTNNLIAILCSLFFVIAPPLIFKFPYQFTLAAHFLILLSFCPFVFEYTKKQHIIFCFLLGFLTCGVMIYFFLFVLVNIVAYTIYRYYKSSKGVRLGLVMLVSLVSGTLLAFTLSGGFVHDMESSGLGFGIFSANLNTFINPINKYELFKSNLFPFLNSLKLHTPEQNEGFAYLGGGFIVLLILTIGLLFKKYNKKERADFRKKYNLEIKTFLFVFFTLFLFAITTDVTLADKKIMAIPVPQFIDEILSIFRASGRYIWNCFYLIYFVVFAFFIRNVSAKNAMIVLSLCFALQVYDINDAFRFLHKEYQTRKEYVNPLDTHKVWLELTKGKKYIAISNYYPAGYINFAEWAIRNRFKSNNLQLSRDIDYEKFYLNLLERYKNPRKEDIYIFSEEDEGYVAKETNLKHCYDLNNKYIACITTPLDNIEELDLENDSRYKKSRAYSLYKILFVNPIKY